MSPILSLCKTCPSLTAAEALEVPLERRVRRINEKVSKLQFDLTVTGSHSKPEAEIQRLYSEIAGLSNNTKPWRNT